MPSPDFKEAKEEMKNKLLLLTKIAYSADCKLDIAWRQLEQARVEASEAAQALHDKAEQARRLFGEDAVPGPNIIRKLVQNRYQR